MTPTSTTTWIGSALAQAARAVAIAPAAAGVQLPPGFALIDAYPEVVFDRPTDIAFRPDGGAFVSEKSGRVLSIDWSEGGESTPFIDLSGEVLDSGDLGLLSVALDPEYAIDPWVYLLFTADPDGDGVDDETDAFCRLVRYRASIADPNVADPASRQVLLGASWPEGAPSMSATHSVGQVRFGADGSRLTPRWGSGLSGSSVGQVRFGADGSLLVSMGEGAQPAGVDEGGRDPGGFGPGRSDPGEDMGAFRARTLESLSGKILRLDRTSGAGLASNPFFSGDPFDVRSRVLHYGLRNPYRFAVRPGTGSATSPGTLYIADVGWVTYEEINVARGGGVNFGWPCYEGPSVESQYQEVSSVATMNADVLCSAPPSADVPGEETAPSFHYHHADPDRSNPIGWTGWAVTGLAFYTASSYPSTYHGRLFVADYALRWIHTVALDENDALTSWDGFATGFESQVVGIAAHPLTGDLHVVQFFANAIRRIAYGGPVSTPAGSPPVGEAEDVVRPNPSEGAVTIVFAPDRPAEVRVGIFDARGSRVRELGPFSVTEGLARIGWDGRDASGGRVPAGVYFYRVLAPGNVFSGKLVVAG